ncbi:MAG: GNAT family N-acetyltransferase [Synechococcales bacterium]|nr:GNAT family N-acetyltransferase [Synechococcales bacterium]
MVTHCGSQITVKWFHHFSLIPQPAWDLLALPLQTPFLEWQWLNNLETSGSVSAKTGWLPNHLTLWQDGVLIAAAPLYIKNHSYGEFVFDYQWAELASRIGAPYYPKLLGMVPFTPTQGYRFLIAPGENDVSLTELMMDIIHHFCQHHHLGGCHFLFVDSQWQPVAEQCGFSPWLHHSYIWQNHGYQTFDDYLAMFNANQRRNIKRERKSVAKAGFHLRVLTGDQISPDLFPLIYEFYSHTCDQFMWGSKYLTQQFFEQLYPSYCHRVLLVVGYSTEDSDHPIGLSFCIYKGHQLYGRYWGSFEEVDCLHFNACYYSPIEWAIAHNIQTFDPGAGGKHKHRRGFPATPNYSLHYYYHPRMQQLLRRNIQEINAMEQTEINSINQDLPFCNNSL